MVEVMAARTLITGEPATMRGIALEPKRRPTPRNEGVDLPDALEAVFARALSLDPRARQRHAGVFWNELVAALDQPEPSANTRAFEIAEDLEFDPSSVRRLAAAPVRVSAPYSIPLSAPGRMPAASRPSAPAPAPASASASASAPAPMRTAAASAPHFVPDLELAPPSVSRRPSGQRPVAQPAPAQADLLELDSASVPAVLALDLDLPADEPRAQRSVSSQRLAAVRPSNPPPAGLASSGMSGSMTAAREPPPGSPTSGVIATRSNSGPPPSADVSASFAAGFVAKIEPRLLEERSLAQRLRTAIALFGAAILVAIFDPIYAAVTGEVLEIAGQRLSRLAGALLVLAVGLAAREVTRER